MEITDVAEVFQKELWISTASQEILDPLFFSQVNENLADRLKRAGLVLKNVIFFPYTCSHFFHFSSWWEYFTDFNYNCIINTLNIQLLTGKNVAEVQTTHSRLWIIVSNLFPVSITKCVWHLSLIVHTSETAALVLFSKALKLCLADIKGISFACIFWQLDKRVCKSKPLPIER